MLYEIDEHESNRITIVKGLLIVLVVFIHSYREEVTFLEGNVILSVPVWLEWLKYTLSQVIARCAVPAFFLISSILLYRKEFTWKQNMVKKMNTILVPYLLLNSFWILFFYFAQFIEFSDLYLVTPQSQIGQWGLIGWLDAYFGNFIDEYPALYPMWFLRDLFLLNAAALLIKKCVDAFPRLVLLLIAAMWLLPIPIPLIGGTELSGQSVVFFILGYYVVKYDLHIRQLDAWRGSAFILLYTGAVLLAVATREYVFHYTICHITILIGIVGIARLSRRLEAGAGKACYMRFARYSFCVFAFHEMGLTIMTKLLTQWLPQNAWVQLLEYLVLPILIICICVGFGMALRRIAPGFYQVLVGRRI